MNTARAQYPATNRSHWLLQTEPPSSANTSRVTRMAEEQIDRLQSFRAFIKEAEEGATIPPVGEDDLKSLHDACVEMTRRYCGKDGVLSIDLMARVCSRDANLPAVWLRHTQLRSLVRQGLLAEWQHGAALDEAVFRVAANITMQGVRFDPRIFVRELHQRATV